MTEAEWLACDNPTPMLEFLRHSRPTLPALKVARRSKRKLGLFICACYRRTWSILCPDSRKLVDDYEQYCEGTVQWQAVEQVYWAGIRRNEERLRAEEKKNGTVGFYNWESPREHFANPGELAIRLARSVLVDENGWDFGKEQQAQCQFLRDVFKPFCVVDLATAWMTAAVKQMAEAIYTDRAFDRLPILADALEDAGCDNRDMLDHCRQPGEHARGCWVVDLVLGKS